MKQAHNKNSLLCMSSLIRAAASCAMCPLSLCVLTPSNCHHSPIRLVLAAGQSAGEQAEPTQSSTSLADPSQPWREAAVVRV